MELLSGIILGVYIFLLRKNFFFGLYMIFFSLPLYVLRINGLGIPTTALELMIYIQAVSWIYLGFKNNQKDFPSYFEYITFLLQYLFLPQQKISNLKKVYFSKNIHSIKYFLYLFLIIGLVSVFISQNTFQALGIYKAYFVNVVLLQLILLSTVTKNRQIKYIFYALFLSATYVSLYAIVQYIFDFGLLYEQYHDIINKRATSLYEYPNAIGLYVAPILGLAFPIICEKFSSSSIKTKFWMMVFLIINIGGIAVAQTEAALLALGCVLLLFFFYRIKKEGRILFISFGVMMLFAIHLFMPTLFSHAYQKITLQDFSGKIRQNMYEETVVMLKDRPLLGAGLASYQKVMEPYHNYGVWINNIYQPVEIYLYPHNIFLNFWAETGFLGMVYALLLFIVSLYKFFEDQSLFHQMLILGVLIIFIHGIFDVPFFKNDLSILFVTIFTFFYLPKKLKKVI